MAGSNLKLQPPTQRDREVTLRQWLMQGAELQQNGALDDAEVYYKAILKAQPNNLDAKHLLGTLKTQQGKCEEAVKLIRSVIAAGNHLHIAHTNLGNALYQLGRKEEALASYEKAVVSQPNYVEAQKNAAVVLFELGRLEEALTYADRSVAGNPGYAEAQFNRANILRLLNRLDEASAAYTKTLSLDPKHCDAHFNMGITLQSLGRMAEALVSYTQALELRPQNVDTLLNRAATLNALRRFDEAIIDIKTALNLAPERAETHNLHGETLRMLGRTEEETCCYERAIALQPDYIRAINNLGSSRLELDGPEAAASCFARSHAIKPGDPATRFNSSLVQLLTGDFAAGWEGYALRFKLAENGPRSQIAGIPFWQGEEPRGKRLLVFEEQGIGDILQFMRFLPLVVALGADVTLFLRPALYRLIAPFAERFGGGALNVITQIDRRDYDIQCSLLDLPTALKTTIETIPAEVPYLTAEPDIVRHWAERIGAQGYKIGIAWQGNPEGAVDVGRSIPLRAFEALAKTPGVRLISLQKRHGLEQLATLPDGMLVETLGDAFDNGPDAFTDTAAAMTHLDLIITSDTSIAHLAGALGRPTWLALKKVPDWRWLLERTDSPWYPTMRLYRQTTRGDWADVFTRMAADLATR